MLEMFQDQVSNPNGLWIILGCALFVLGVRFGGTLCHRLGAFNKKYHLVGIDHYSVSDDDCDDDF